MWMNNGFIHGWNGATRSRETVATRGMRGKEISSYAALMNDEVMILTCEPSCNFRSASRRDTAYERLHVRMQIGISTNTEEEPCNQILTHT